MINALFNSLTLLARKPWIFLPTLIVAAIMGVITVSTIETYFMLLFNLTFFNQMPQTTLLELPFRIFELYPIESSILLGMLAVMFFLNSLLLLIYAHLVKEEIERKKSSLLNAVRNAFSQIGQTILLFILIALVGLFLGIVYLAFFALMPLSGFSWIILLIIFLLIIYIAIKLLFTIPALAEAERTITSGKKIVQGKGGIKQALEESWQFTDKHLFGTIALIIILFIVTAILTSIVGTIGELIELEEASIAVMYVLLAIIGTLADLSICYYYFLNKK